MNPGLWALAYPILVASATWWLASRIYYRRYRWGLGYLGISVVTSVWVLVYPDYALAWGISQPFLIIANTGVVGEVFWLSCKRMSESDRRSAIGWALFVAILAAVGMTPFLTLSPLRWFLLVRQFYLIILAVALTTLALWMWKHPVRESRDYRGYRICMMLNSIRVAASASFTFGGMGYLLIPATDTAYQWVNRILWALAPVPIVIMAIWMTSDVSCLRPSVAAKKRLLETDNAWLGG